MVLSRLENAPEPFLRALSLSILTYFRMYLGDFRKASRTLLLLRMFLQSEEAPLISRIKSRECEIAYCLLTGSREEGLKAASESLKIAQATGARLAAVRILGNKAYILMANRDFRGAGDLLDQVTPLLGIMNPVNVSFYHIIKARLSQGLGDPEEALSHADIVLKMALESNNIWWQLPGLISKAYILHQLGRKEDAENHLAQVVQTARKIRSRLWEFVAELAGALFSLDQGNERKAIQQLRRAMGMGREGGYFSTHLYQPDGLAKVCEKALEAEIEPDYVKEFIRRLRLVPPESSPPSEKWPWRLKIMTLGKFGVWIDEKPIRFSRKGQQKPIALLKILIAMGGKGIKSEQVSDLLWPEADGGDA
jgi:tetratricopeptide (TPR) repeat protein